MSNIKIAILGMGNVGTGVYQILQENNEEIYKYLNGDIEVEKILVRTIDKKRKISIPNELLTNNYDDILSDESIKIVVELMGGIHPALDYIKRAIKSGKHVVTANKAVMATYGKELKGLAKENGVFINYEASVGGGIPIINTLMESLAANKIEEIIGIINGTTNYILTQMTNYNMSFEEALKLAQTNGYAEADPTSDIEGEDAAFKISILTSIAYGINIPSKAIEREGITKIHKSDIDYASELGYKIKLLAVSKRCKDNIEIYVYPSLVPNEHPLASISNEFNALFVRGNAVGELLLYGKGAGSLPTGSAVLADILSVARLIKNNIGNDKNKNDKFNDIQIKGIGESQYYIRLQVVDKPGVLGKIAMTFGEYDISLESVMQKGRGEETVPLVFITHDIEKNILDKALDEINAYDFVEKIATILKVENI
ncbi:homoserine dehydrogenase [Paramaledivibacter caminithermalis]|jgi:homoserine dehydrogenase|uniref:Homoserine dehydrogenase n=1 Tax=Paramaledivibacter caminithermalis (strain DSM 15212 / CIP 107654 / DViRD3) TaxID=1121301 RepID=A0A1M6Q647_PARC5|nr:homoserine dehydrogenase [Paramaledivibacter caminithermalis]SHK15618.1 homoserine dehydrogenase [Paramaledivibacter caminithermalis DSM 15212]